MLQFRPAGFVHLSGIGIDRVEKDTTFAEMENISKSGILKK